MILPKWCIVQHKAKLTKEEEKFVETMNSALAKMPL